MQRKIRKSNNDNNSKIYGSIVKLKGKRTEPFAVRITLGYDKKGFPIYEFLDTFTEELDAELCRRDYSRNPYDIVISHQKFEKIVSFAKLPSSVIDASTIIEEEDKTGYTFKQVYEEWKMLYFPTKEEIEKEELTHKKTKGKFSKSNMGNLAAAFNNSKKLHDKLYRNLRKVDFEQTINSTVGKRSKLYNMRNLYVKLDEYAYEKNIIDKCYADKVHVDCEEDNTNRHPYSYEEIKFLWTMQGNRDVDILLILLYTCMRIEELLSLEIKNIYLDGNYIRYGLKSQSGKNRIIPIHSQIRHIVDFYYNKNKNKNYLFVNEKGNKIEYKKYYRKFLEMKEKWGENNFNQSHVVHETRHSAETELDKRGANKRCRDLIMGHKSKDVGDRVYNHKTIEELKETIELISYRETTIFEYKNETELRKTNCN